MPLTLKDHILRTTYVFQAIVPFIVILSMSAVVFDNFHYPYYSIYHFIKSGFSVILAAGITFIAILQRRRGPPYLTKNLSVRLEAGKSLLATAIWLWILIDALVGGENLGYDPHGKEQEKRIIFAVVGSVVLYILYYPTLVYAIADARSNGDEEVMQREEEELLLAQ